MYVIINNQSNEGARESYRSVKICKFAYMAKILFIRGEYVGHKLLQNSINTVHGVRMSSHPVRISVKRNVGSSWRILRLSYKITPKKTGRPFGRSLISRQRRLKTKFGCPMRGTIHNLQSNRTKHYRHIVSLPKYGTRKLRTNRTITLTWQTTDK